MARQPCSTVFKNWSLTLVLNQQSDSLASTNASRCDPVASAGALQLTGNRYRQAHSRRCQRMTDRDRSSVDVDLRVVKSEFSLAGKNLSGKSFVDLNPVNLVK